MNRFEELCKSYADARKKFFAYRDECVSFAGLLVGSLLRFLECPQTQAEMVPVISERETGWKHYGPLAVEMDEHDQLWRFGLILTLYENPNVRPYGPYLLHFAFQKSLGSFVVKLDGKQFTITGTEESAFDEINRTIFETMKNYFDSGLERFIEGERGDKARSIAGFINPLPQA